MKDFDNGRVLKDWSQMEMYDVPQLQSINDVIRGPRGDLNQTSQTIVRSPVVHF